MILIDALYINEGGGLVLLNYLISELNNNKKNVYYLLDDRIKYKHKIVGSNCSVKYIKANIFDRHLFYINNKNNFKTVFCFSNIPPTVNLKGIVYTYFHSSILLNIPKEYTFILKIKFKLKTLFIKYFTKNTNFWIVQTEVMKNNFSSNFGINKKSILKIPFYPPFPQLHKIIIKKQHSYLYVSDGKPHKNHLKLISAFCRFYDKSKIGTLSLTINDEYSDLLNLIREKINLGYPIVNHGFIDRTQLQRIYLESKFLIFPSLAESFGLGLVEAIDCDCFIIGADLPYTFEVCDPSLTFNPHSVDSIFDVFEKSLNNNIISSKSKIQNKIFNIINLLQSN